MPIPKQFEKEDQIPDGLKQFYVAKDGRFVLDVDGDDEAPSGDAADVSKIVRALEHERKQRADAVKERESLRGKVSELEQALKTAASLQGSNDSKTSDIGDELKKQLLAQKSQYDEQIRQLSSKIDEERKGRETAETRLSEGKILDLLREASNKVGIRSEAVFDAINRAKPYWRINKDTQEPMPYDGEMPLYGTKDPTRPMPADEFMERIAKEAPHLLKPSTGTGAQGSTAAGGQKAYQISRLDAKDPIKYRAARDAADKAGAELKIAD